MHSPDSELSMSQLASLEKLERIQWVRNGITGSSFRRVVDEAAAPDVFTASLGADREEIENLYKKKTLTSGQSETILDTLCLLLLAYQVWGSRDLAMQWINSTVPDLDSLSPLELLDTFEGRRWLSQVLRNLGDGYFS